MPELETKILELMRGGIRKFDGFLDQIPDEFFGLQDSAKAELQKKFKTLWEANPYQTAKQIIDILISKILNDRTCPDGNALKQILTVGANTDFTKPDLPTEPIFLGEMEPADFVDKTFVAKNPGDIN